MEFIASYSDLPVYVKGPQCREDVERSLDAGASGIWVTNHGGRQIDGGPAAFDSLQEVAEEIIEKNWQMGVVHHLSGAVQKCGQDYGFTQNLRR